LVFVLCTEWLDGCIVGRSCLSDYLLYFSLKCLYNLNLTWSIRLFYFSHNSSLYKKLLPVHHENLKSHYVSKIKNSEKL